MVDKKVLIKLNARNAKRLQKLGYRIPENSTSVGCKLGYKKGTSIEIDIKDLSRGSKVKVKRTCDSCKRIDLVKYRDLGSEELCKKCSKKLFFKENNPFYGKTHDADVRKRISLANKKVDDKAILKYLEDSEYAPTSSKVSSELGINRQTILNVVNRNNKRELLYKNNFQSSAEKSLINFLKNNYKGDIIVKDRSVLSGKELDIYLPKLSLAFEFNGLWWHSEDKVGKYYHKNKYEKCMEKGVALYTIWEHVYNNSPEKVRLFLKKLVTPKTRIYARSCEIVNDPKKLKAFIKEHHLQGLAPSHTYLGLSYNNSIVMAISIASHHRMGGRPQVLNRVCFSKYSVVGGLEKLLKKINTPLITWSDNSYSPTGNMYKNSGFELEEELPPDYFYTAGDSTYLSKQSQAKRKTNCPKDLTELQWTTKRGLYRVWDAGKKRWRWTP